MLLVKKKTFVLTCLIFSNICFGQSLSKKIVSNGLYNIKITDSTAEQIQRNQILGFNFEFYSSHSKYKIRNGNVISLNVYQDSLMYYEENDSAGKFLNGGELRIDTSRLFIDTDTLFYWVQHGKWKYPIDNNILRVISYDMGAIVTEHIEIGAAVCTEEITIEVNKNEYSLNDNSTIYSFNLPSHEILRKQISSKWYHPDCMDYVIFEDPIWFFLSDKPKNNPRNGTVESIFKSNGVYNSSNHFLCGTGLDKDDIHSKYYWELTEDGFLIIGVNEYQIMYLDEQSMILK